MTEPTHPQSDAPAAQDVTYPEQHVVAILEGADATREGVSRKGRASYVGDRAKGHPDPGAVAVATWLTGIRDEVDGR